MENDKTELFEKVMVAILVLVFAAVMLCCAAKLTRSQNDHCHITEITQYVDENGAKHKKVINYFVPKNERPITL